MLPPKKNRAKWEGEESERSKSRDEKSAGRVKNKSLNDIQTEQVKESEKKELKSMNTLKEEIKKEI